MAHKVATTYIIDVSPSMEVKQEGADITCFQQSINAVAGLVQDKVGRFARHSPLCIAVLTIYVAVSWAKDRFCQYHTSWNRRYAI
jgi:hypothetical protein